MGYEDVIWAKWSQWNICPRHIKVTGILRALGDLDLPPSPFFYDMALALPNTALNSLCSQGGPSTIFRLQLLPVAGITGQNLQAWSHHSLLLKAQYEPQVGAHPC